MNGPFPPSTTPPQDQRWLVLGYGNELRSDDAVGPLIARAVAAWGDPDVDARDLHQLTPEFAEPISRAAVVVFVDAVLASADVPATMVPLSADAELQPDGHLSSPEGLLAMAGQLYGRRPQAWLLKVPVQSLEFGETLSPLAQRNVEAALARLRAHRVDWASAQSHGQQDSTDQR